MFDFTLSPESPKTEASGGLYDVVIVGGGPAGLTAAIYTSRDGMKTLVLEREGTGGLAATTEMIENYPGFPDGVNGMELMDSFRKQADRMLSRAFAERLEPQGISVNACHPGDVNSRLSNNLGFGGHESPDQGARTPVWLGTAPELEGRTGGYYEHQREAHCRFSEDRGAVDGLLLACEAYAEGERA